MTAKILTQSRLKELLHYCPETGVFTWLVNRGYMAKAGSIVGGFNFQGYRRTRIDGIHHFTHRLAFLYMTGEMPIEQVDHINQIKDDNRFSNLRLCSPIENKRNNPKQKNNTSGYTGIQTREKCINKRYLSYIYIGKNQVRLGSFSEIWEAICARKSAEYLYGFHKNHGIK